MPSILEMLGNAGRAAANVATGGISNYLINEANKPSQEDINTFLQAVEAGDTTTADKYIQSGILNYASPQRKVDVYNKLSTARQTQQKYTPEAISRFGLSTLAQQGLPVNGSSISTTSPITPKAQPMTPQKTPDPTKEAIYNYMSSGDRSSLDRLAEAIKIINKAKVPKQKETVAESPMTKRAGLEKEAAQTEYRKKSLELREKALSQKKEGKKVNAEPLEIRYLKSFGGDIDKITNYFYGKLIGKFGTNDEKGEDITEQLRKDAEAQAAAYLATEKTETAETAEEMLAKERKVQFNEGFTKTIGGVTYVFIKGDWYKQ